VDPLRRALRRTVQRGAQRLLPRLPAATRELALTLAARAGSGPAVLPGPPEGPVLVVAPHPDDETIGCGGALVRHAAAGDRVTVVVATSGESTGGGGRDVAAAREEEARLACAALGVGDPVFLRLPDRGLRAQAARLGARLRELGAEARTVYVPSLLDPHPDHRAANHGVAAARLQAHVLGYEVWSPAPVDGVLDVTGVYARKEEAMRCYAVALESADYLGAARGLAAYRGITAGLGAAALAEGFLRLDPAEHAALCARADR
jgi:LmbE family N-acetylglucosaminyl deacetylase